MENNRRKFGLAGAVLAVLLAAFGIFWMLRDAARDMANNALKTAVTKVKTKAKDELLQALGNVTAKGAQLSGTDEQGRPAWSAGAQRSEVKTSEDGQVSATLFGARATIYKEGIPTSAFRCKQLEIANGTDDKVTLILIGDVTAQSSTAAFDKKKSAKKIAAKPVQLTSPRVEIDVTTRHLSAPQGATLSQGAGRELVTVTAQKMDADAGLATANLSGGVTATAPQGTLKAAAAQWNWQTGRALATGGVTATHEQTILTGARLDADKQGRSGTISGGVRVTTQGGSASAGSASYNWAAHQIVAVGGVTITNGEATLTAASAECDDKLSKATASGGVTIKKGAATLRAPRIVALEKFARASAEGGVTLTQNDLTVTAANATATGLGDKKNLRVVASGGVTAKNATGTVRAAKVTWGGGTVTATGGVRAQRAGLQLSGDNFTADDAGHHANLTGQVVITHPTGATLKAPRARYEKAANKVWAEGGITYQDAAGSTMRGDSLTADLNLKSAKTMGLDGTVNVNGLEGKGLF